MRQHLAALAILLLPTISACTDIPDLQARLFLEIHTDPASGAVPDTVRVALTDAAGTSYPKSIDDPAWTLAVGQGEDGSLALATLPMSISESLVSPVRLTGLGLAHGRVIQAVFSTLSSDSGGLSGRVSVTLGTVSQACDAKGVGTLDCSVAGCCPNGWFGSSARPPPVCVGEWECSPLFPREVLIPAGTFTMGSPASELGRYADETQHSVTLTRSFYLQTTEVTEGQWAARMGNDPSSDACGADCPVETVNWWEALAYANALSTSEGLAVCYTLEGCSGAAPGEGMACAAVSVNAPGGDPYRCAGYRLPTEAEWEYAYRAGTSTAFYNGDITDTSCGDPKLDLIGWYCGNSGSEKHPVAQKASNAWGLYDMSGNVWEWCWDRLADYPSGSAIDPHGPEQGSDRVVRGGSWSGDAFVARAAFRYFVDPGGRGDVLGFRLARSAP